MNKKAFNKLMPPILNTILLKKQAFHMMNVLTSQLKMHHVLLILFRSFKCPLGSNKKFAQIRDSQQLKSCPEAM